jgi:hypothetical protein
MGYGVFWCVHSRFSFSVFTNVLFHGGLESAQAAEPTVHSTALHRPIRPPQLKLSVDQPPSSDFERSTSDSACDPFSLTFVRIELNLILVDNVRLFDWEYALYF